MDEYVISAIVILVVLGGGFYIGRWMHENLSGRAQTIGAVVVAVIMAVSGIVITVFNSAFPY